MFCILDKTYILPTHLGWCDSQRNIDFCAISKLKNKNYVYSKFDTAVPDGFPDINYVFGDLGTNSDFVPDLVIYQGDEEVKKLYTSNINEIYIRIMPDQYMDLYINCRSMGIFKFNIAESIKRNILILISNKISNENINNLSRELEEYKKIVSDMKTLINKLGK